MEKEEIKKLTERYPFLLPRDWTGEVPSNYDYSYINCFENGWKDIFLEYCENILPWYNSLDEESKKQFYFTELKEKYGQMRIYPSFTSNEESKFNHIATIKSEWTCYSCGKQPRDSKGNHLIWTSRGWIEHLCKDCVMKDVKDDKMSFKETRQKLKKYWKRETHNANFYCTNEKGWKTDLFLSW